jgi:hypothetical protein
MVGASGGGRGRGEAEVDDGRVCSHGSRGRWHRCEDLTCAGQNLAKCGGW